MFCLECLNVFWSNLKALAKRWVFSLVDLHSALDQIQWDDGGVGQTTRESTTDHTFQVVLGGSELTAESIFYSSSQHKLNIIIIIIYKAVIFLLFTFLIIT